MKAYNENLDETIISGRLQNGLNYYIIPKSLYKEKRALLTVKYGSVDSAFKIGGNIYETPQGCAHFLEHKLFDGERGSAFESFSRLGSYVNAYTSFNNTAYYFSSEKDFEQNLKTLMDFVSEPYFTEASVKKEVPIIGQEISMYDDNPAWSAYFNMLDCLYESHPAKNNIAGTQETISRITADTLYKCYESFYVPENMYLICVGGFDAEEIEQITEIAGRYMLRGGERAETVLPREADCVKSGKRVKKMGVSRPVFQIGFKDRDFSGQTRKSCVLKILLDLFIGESSLFKERLVEKRLADDTLSFDYICGNGYGYAAVSGESAEPCALLEEIVREARGRIENGFDEADFQRLKKKHTGRFARGFNSVEAITMASAEYAVKGAGLFDCYEYYTEIELVDCHTLMPELFREEGFALSVLEP